MAEIDRRNLEVRVKELGEVMKELNLETLMSHKQANEKNTHLLTDSLQKLDSAVVPFALSRNLSPSSSTAPSAMSFQSLPLRLLFVDILTVSSASRPTRNHATNATLDSQSKKCSKTVS